MTVDGVERRVLVDSGCSCCIVYAPVCKWTRRKASVTTVNGQLQECKGVGRVWIRTADGAEAEVDALVVDFKPLGLDCILGVDGISALGGVTISSCSVNFGASQLRQGGVCAAAMEIDRQDFKAFYSEKLRTWTVSWQWTEEPGELANKIAEYAVPPSIREAYESELQRWITEGWLIPYDEEKLGPAKGLIPLLAVAQSNKAKVRPVLDYRELNLHIDAYTADVDVCADKLREWRQKGVRTAMLDLSTAYMQVHVHESLWPFQTVILRGKRYCLTRLGFGLNIASAAMKAILTEVLALDERVCAASSPYVDDVYVNEEIVSVEYVRDHLLRYGLVCKQPQRVADGARVLGLQVWGEEGKLLWKRVGKIPDVPDIITRRSVFSFCGKLVGHLPICGWLRPAASFVKRRVNELSHSWDDEVLDEGLRVILQEMWQLVCDGDPARGRWDVHAEEATVWVDASSIASGAVITVQGQTVEDASWLRRENESHINMAELDAVLKGVNMGLLWGTKRLHLRTDSQAVYNWVSDALSGKARLKTKAASEMLIRRRLGVLKDLVKEYDLQVDIALVPSKGNLADRLTRVPQRWFKPSSRGSAQGDVLCAAIESFPRKILEIHHSTGHQGVDRTLYFVRKVFPTATSSAVREAISNCQECRSFNLIRPP